jgi:hypothetical protein
MEVGGHLADLETVKRLRKPRQQTALLRELSPTDSCRDVVEVVEQEVRASFIADITPPWAVSRDDEATRITRCCSPGGLEHISELKIAFVDLQPQTWHSS